MSEDGIAIILVVVSVFGTHIASLDAWIKFMVLITDRDEKRMNAVFLVVDVKVGEHDSMIGVNTQIADPPLCACSTIAVNDETLGCKVICGCGHEALNIRSMA